MKTSNNLDEMQEQKLLHIEHNMAWIAFYGLFASILGHILLLGVDGLRYLVGELVVFNGICLYMLVDCLRNSIWDRKYRPGDKKRNLLVCLAFSAAFSGVMAVVIYRNTGKVLPALAGFAFFLGILVLSCMGLLALVGKLYSTRVKQLENGDET